MIFQNYDVKNGCFGVQVSMIYLSVFFSPHKLEKTHFSVSYDTEGII